MGTGHRCAGDNYIGFRFLSGTDMLYGFALLNLDTTNGVATIQKWAYNDTPDGAVHVEDITAVPEPGTAALALLGLGAGGLRAWRSRRKAERA
ncbi:MAG TPA: PEP-CTERM sorting domain-containing protein, partial [Rubrivivax sp.]|nr:PEP-CTERM sorting domain-containing protein [Rubrivivax sp.]